MSATTCAFLNFYEDVVNGQNSQVPAPRWVGISGISSKLTDTNKALDDISTNADTAFNGDRSWSKDSQSDFTKKLTDTYSAQQGQTITTGRPGSNTAIQTLQMRQYGDYTTSGTALNLIYQEYNTVVTVSLAGLDKAQDYSKTIKSQLNSVKSSISSVQTQIDSITKSFKTVETTVLDNWIMVQKKLDDTGLTAFLILFAILFSFAFLATVCLLFFIFLGKIQKLRWLLHVIWMLTMIITILTFIIGGVFTGLSILSNDGVVTLKDYVFASANLLGNCDIIDDKTVCGYIDTCINKKGDLADNFGLKSGNTQVLSDFYDQTSYLKSMSTRLSANLGSKMVVQINQQYQDAMKDISKTTDSKTHGNDDIGSLFTSFNGVTEPSSGGCSHDQWVSDSSLCSTGTGHSYSSAQSPASLGTKTCLAVPDWSSSSAGARYPTDCTVNGQSVSTVAGSYVGSLNTYMTNNKALLNKLTAANNDIDTQFKSTTAKLKTNLDQVNGVITPLSNVFESILGTSGFFSLINCSFMKADLNILYDQLQNNLSPKSNQLGAVIVAVSFLELVSVFFLVIVINKYYNLGNINPGVPSESNK
jgi:hypothetical protein